MSTPSLGSVAVILAASAILRPAVCAARETPGQEGISLATKSPSDAIVGEWCTQQEKNRPPGRIRFIRADDGTYTGVLSWSADPKKDVHNGDPKLRDRPLVGIVLIWHLRYEDGEYVDGYVYNPEDGGTYRLKAEVLGPESLKVRGYLGIALLGQTKVWSRFHSS